MLTGFLDFHRATLATKCEGLTDAQLRQRAVPPSALSLLGLVRHMAEMEGQFRMVFTGEPMRGIWAPGPDLDVDAAFREAGTASAADAFAAWQAECENSRKLTDAAVSLDVGAEFFGETWWCTGRTASRASQKIPIHAGRPGSPAGESFAPGTRRVICGATDRRPLSHPLWASGPMSVHRASRNRGIYATSGRVMSGDRRCNTRSGLVRGTVLHVATAVPASASTASRTWCGVVMM